MKIVPLTPMGTPGSEVTVALLLHDESAVHELLRVPWDQYDSRFLVQPGAAVTFYDKAYEVMCVQFAR